jgi:sugar lactone lactonase YvrE
MCENPMSPVPFGSFAPAQLQFVQPGLSAEWFVAPGAFNMPEEVFIAPDGKMLVFAVRGNTLYRVSGEGAVSIVAEKASGYLGDIDSKGNVYLHNPYDGGVMRISPDGQVTTIVQSLETRSDCDSGFGLRAGWQPVPCG